MAADMRSAAGPKQANGRGGRHKGWMGGRLGGGAGHRRGASLLALLAFLLGLLVWGRRWRLRWWRWRWRWRWRWQGWRGRERRWGRLVPVPVPHRFEATSHTIICIGIVFLVFVIPQKVFCAIRDAPFWVHRHLQGPKIDGYVFWAQNLCIVLDGYSPISSTVIDKIKELSSICIRIMFLILVIHQANSPWLKLKLFMRQNDHAPGWVGYLRVGHQIPSILCWKLKLCFLGIICNISLVIFINKSLRLLSYPRITYLCKHCVRLSLIGPSVLDHRFLVPLAVIFMATWCIWCAILYYWQYYLFRSGLFSSRWLMGIPSSLFSHFNAITAIPSE
jgi:hypothetical protein